jgi:Protein of unknown function (DUF3455)
VTSMAPGAGRETCSSAQCRPSIRQPSFATPATVSTAGFLDLSNPFHVAQGSDGRSCESCHLPHDDARQIITHFLSPNPDEGGTARATWQHSRDTSTVWAMAIASSFDPAFVEPGAIPWLLLRVVGADRGPTGGHKLTATAYMQRVHTSGGLAPTTGCTQAPDVGKRALVPYTADYFFYKATGDE